MSKAEIGKTYRHYKGEFYTVIAIGKHAETNENLVVYRQEVANKNGLVGTVWIRPKEMWESKVEFQGEVIERFTLNELK